ELITGVNIAQGGAPLSQCPSFDINGDNMVGINELITAVNNALGSCTGGATPTPTQTPGAGGTERTFTLDPGVLLADPSGTGSGLFTTGLSGSNASNGPDNGFSPGPLTLVLGTQDGNGVASLKLKEDVFLTIGIIDGSHLCMKLQAQDSDGSIDCDGGTAYDTTSSQPAGDVGFPFAIETGLGDPAGPGNGNLLIPTLYKIIQATDPDGNLPCSEVTYTNPIQTFPFTTTKATSVKPPLDPLSVPGAPFDCAKFAMSGSGGQLAAGAPATQAPVGSVNNVFRLAEHAPQ
ncbi:MAG TPA: hypothetical protein VL049_30455, partial [Candidatus Dormibacteraeota bacterium]|nr:hypothetical protein [Candidatus Dormibacteraeota bacterium]